MKCYTTFLIPSELEPSDFIHSATNWGGCDMIERTLDAIRKKPTGQKHILVDPIRFYGADYDRGMSCPWHFKVDEIWELEPDE